MELKNCSMRNHRFFLLFCLLSSCATEKEFVIDKPQYLCARFEQSTSGTKTSLEGHDVVWESGDKIRLISYLQEDMTKNIRYVGNAMAVPEEYYGKVEAVFEGFAASDNKSNVAVYPDLDEANSIIKNTLFLFNNRIHLVIPHIQLFEAGSFGNKANISIAKEETKGTLLFRNVFGLLRLQLLGDATICRMEITSDIDEPLCGAATVDLSYGSEGPSLSFSELEGEKNNSIVLESPEGVALNNETPVTVYIAIPPGSLSKGFSLILYDSDNGCMKLHGIISESNEIVRSMITSMPLITYERNDITPDEGAKTIVIEHTNEVFSAPMLYGEDKGWKVFWGDGIGSMYYPGITHTYHGTTKKSVTIQANGVERFSIEQLTGIDSIDVSNLH